MTSVLGRHWHCGETMEVLVTERTLLKGNGVWEILRETWPIALFAAIALTIGVKRYRQTLD